MVFQPTGKNIWFRQIGSWNPLNFELKKYLNCQHLSTDIYVFLQLHGCILLPRNDPPNLLPNFAPPKSPLVFFPRQRHHSPRNIGLAVNFLDKIAASSSMECNLRSAPPNSWPKPRVVFFWFERSPKNVFLGESEGELFLFCWFLFWQIIAKKIERKEQKVRTMKNDSERMTKMFWKSSQRNNDLNLTSRNPRNSDLEFEKEYNLKYPAKKKSLKLKIEVISNPLSTSIFQKIISTLYINYLKLYQMYLNKNEYKSKIVSSLVTWFEL